MYVYIVERIEWSEAHREEYHECRKVIGASMSIDSVKDMVRLDSEYYTYPFKWANNHSYVGFREDYERASGVRYEIRVVPYK